MKPEAPVMRTRLSAISIVEGEPLERQTFRPDRLRLDLFRGQNRYYTPAWTPGHFFKKATISPMSGSWGMS